MGRPKFTSKLLLPLQRSPSPSNTPIPRQTQLITHSDPIQSAVLPQLLPGQTDRPTHGIGESSTPIPLTLYCIDRERRAVIVVSYIIIS